MKRSESWVSSLVQQKVFMRVGRLPAVVSSGTHKRSAEAKKTKSETQGFVVGKSIIGEGGVV